MEGNHIILSAINEVEAKPMTRRHPAYSNKKSITGTIVDMSGEPVIGANIVEVGTTRRLPTWMAIFIGCGRKCHTQDLLHRVPEQTISTAGKSSLEVVLVEDTQALEEVIVIGYGTPARKVSGSSPNVSSMAPYGHPALSVRRTEQLRSRAFTTAHKTADGTTFPPYRFAGETQSPRLPVIPSRT